ncbi:DHH family phosphoesterase [Neptunitalea lumnitzerae]|uniref:Exopolyphosphatase n=1 Tax=Neptunitalea lumnitzerae TaxID=2965509 RepID=A0ABQ5MKG1_9FLAO|nr:bifunctional oligoribonuclease/PAP phosphatase NrnA [Neptunitalea sp. Y10]GLB49885.1 exopolyphosphatase [Neptunitalea sp. Y10]
MNTQEITLLKDLLANAKNIIIIPHKNPDGDAMGSTLGLWHYLKSKGHNATIISPNDYPTFLKWLPGESEVLKFDSEYDVAIRKIKEADLIFTLDFNDFSRTDRIQPYLEAASAKFVMIDHHQSPSDYATVTYSDATMSSTCEMVYHFINYLGDTANITKEIADCLYTGIMTDTGSFRFASTTSTTHRVIAALIDCGAENAAIHSNIYDANSISRLHLLGCALKNLTVLTEYNTAYITLSKEELTSYNFEKGDTEGFVNYGLSLTGIKFAAIFIENINSDEAFVKISLRSKGNFDVNLFSRSHFNGGGHINAAGGRSDLSLEETTKRFEELVKYHQDQLVD